MNDFLDSLASNFFIIYILHLPLITSHSKTLIDNIFSNFTSHEIISGSKVVTISDHLIFICSFYPKNLAFEKGIGQNLNKKILYLTIWIKTGLTS